MTDISSHTFLWRLKCSQPKVTEAEKNAMSSYCYITVCILQLYLCISDLFQVYQHYLEEALDMKSYLMVESRSSGPMNDRPDPFTLDDADLGR